MGYNTAFSGVLRFKHSLTKTEFNSLSALLACDDLAQLPNYDELDAMVRQGAERNPGSKRHYYQVRWLGFVIADDRSGLTWNGAEKVYAAENMINFIILYMREKFPNFGLKGKLVAQGEEINDRWFLEIGDNGLAARVELNDYSAEVRCHHCGEKHLVSISDILPGATI